MGGAQRGQLAGSVWSWEVQSVSLLNAAFTLQPLTWAPVIYYRGSVLITYLQYLTLASEISFSLSIRGWEKKSFQNPKCEPREKRWGAWGCFSKWSLKVTKKLDWVLSISERKKIIHSWNFTAFFPTELKHRNQICPNKCGRAAREKTLHLTFIWICGGSHRRTAPAILEGLQSSHVCREGVH